MHILIHYSLISQAVTNSQYKVSEVTTPTEAYKHPYHSEELPIFISVGNMHRLAMDAIGTEPVSPHYDSFVLSRRVPICILIYYELT
jgi:hypothetical protein